MLKRGTAADLEGILALEIRCFGESDGIFNRRQLRSLLGNPKALWLIEGDFEGAACVLLTGNGRQRWGRLYSLSVDPQFRKRGIACRLVEASFAHLRESGISICRAEVKSDNAAARQLYARLGFQEVGELPHYYGLGQTGIKLYRPL